MQTLTTKVLPFLLLVASNALYASNLKNLTYSQVNKENYRPSQPSLKSELLVSRYCSNYNTPHVIAFCIQSFYGNPLKYRNEVIPKDLSEQDLRGFDFTGCNFTVTKLTNTNLADATLTSTTCDYQKAFQENLIRKGCTGGHCYKISLLQDLKSIAQLYPKVQNHTHKVQLLHIASGIAHLPFYTNMEFHVKAQYWSCVFWMLKNKLGKVHLEIKCTLESTFNNTVKNYCWTTEYPQNKVILNEQAPHYNLNLYLENFHNGVKQYLSNSTKHYGFYYYKNQIILNIEGLKEVLQNVKKEKVKKEVCQIAYSLSKSYQIQKKRFLYHYLFYQNRITELQKLINKKAQYQIYYSAIQNNVKYKKGWIHQNMRN